MSKETTAETTAQETATKQPAEKQGADLTVQDLQALKSIIDVASQRGAFRPNEMMTVGQTYNRLEVFLNAVTQQSAKGE